MENTIILTNQYGQDEEFRLLDIVEWKSDRYVVLLPTANPEETCVTILKIAECNDEVENYEAVDNLTLEQVFLAFKEKHIG